jgi:hypothetical protein
MKKFDLSKLPEHMRESVTLYVERGVEPGSFLRAVLENNFVGAFMCADEENIKKMDKWAEFVYSQLPCNCWGSKKDVDEWIKYQSGVVASLESLEEQ